jgi:alkylation response protein AidB-like acyl-CoA dehydrogenase
MEHSLLELAEEQERVDAMRAAAALVLRDRWDVGQLRTMLDDPGPGWEPDLWTMVAELGWADVLGAEADGDAEGGNRGGFVAEFAGIAEEVGRGAASVPLVAAGVAAWLTGPSSSLRTVAFSEAGRSDASRPETGARAADDGYVLDGAKAFVPYGAVADSFVVSAAVDGDDDDLALFVVEAERADLTITALRGMDAMPLADVSLDGVAVGADALIVRGSEARERLAGARARLTVGWAAELVGVAAAVHEAATEYAKHRMAFGRPIGAFQAIKHRLVDLRGDLEVARALVSRAARAVQDDAPDAEAMVALAAFWAAERLRRVPEGAIQVFGGIGYTWEHDAHLYLRKAAVLTALLPPASDACNVAASWLLATA